MNIGTIIKSELAKRGITGQDAENVLAATLEALQAHVVDEVQKSAERRGLTVAQAAEMELGRDVARRLNAKNGRA